MCVWYGWSFGGIYGCDGGNVEMVEMVYGVMV